MAEAEITFLTLTENKKQRIVCDIVEKCYMAGQKVILYVGNEETAQTYDRLLWMWKQNSFIPHAIFDRNNKIPEEPVIISTEDDAFPSAENLILNDPLPMEKFSNFSRVIDFAEKFDLARLEKSRDRFKQYRAAGLSINTMNPGEFFKGK